MCDNSEESAHLREIVRTCEQQIAQGHLTPALKVANYYDIHEALLCKIHIFDYTALRYYLSHEEILKTCVDIGIDARTLSLAHSCYAKFGHHVPRNKEESERLYISGQKYNKFIIHYHRLGFNAYEYAIFYNTTTRMERFVFLQFSKDIKWYAQLRLLNYRHSDVMLLVKSHIPLELCWNACRKHEDMYVNPNDLIRLFTKDR